MSPIPGHSMSDVKWRRGVAAAYVLLLLAMAVLVYNERGLREDLEQNVDQTAALTRGLKETQIDICSKKGNPLREVVQDILREDIESNKNLPPSFFPGIPPHVFHELVRKKREQNEARIKRIKPVNCEVAYSTK